MDLRVPLLLIPLLLAGCSSSGDQSSTPMPNASATLAPSMTTASEAPLTSDTLHLRDPPHLAAAAPTGGNDLHVPVPTVVPPVGVQVLEWTLPRPDLDTLTVNYTLWVDVEGQVLNPVANGTGSGCFWNLSMEVRSQDGSITGFPTCIAEPALVATGVRAITAQVLGADLKDAQGDTLVLQLFTTGIYPAGASVDLLTASPAHDSRFSIQGLELPLGTTTLLAG